jgi:guanine deaminase
MNKYMELAIKQARKGMKRGHGGPFGAVIVRKDKIVAFAHNTVLKDNDATAHAEMNVIRKACRKLHSYDLSDCEIYTTGQPCRMCIGAINWAKIKTVYFGNTYKDALNMGFDDEKGNNSDLKMIRLDSEHTVELIDEWNNSNKRKIY